MCFLHSFNVLVLSLSCKLMSCPKASSVPSLCIISSMPLRRLNIYSFMVYRQEATEDRLLASQACHG